MDKMKFHLEDTREHIGTVAHLLSIFADMLATRAGAHDESKLHEPEASVFAEFTPKLKDSTFGKEEYDRFLEEMEPALKRHYAANRHHPQHYSNGIEGMTLIDLVEMFFDWLAASHRHADGDIFKSIDHNATRFDLPPELVSIFVNTAKFFDGLV
jgi:hypothetical protein